jgi:hypothetical protein
MARLVGPKYPLAQRTIDLVWMTAEHFNHVRFVNAFDGLVFNDNLPIDNQIKSKEGYMHAFIAYAHRHLSLICKLASIKLYAQCLLVNALKEAWSKFLVNGDSGGIDGACHLAKPLRCHIPDVCHVV